jgi:hypothetical protein
MRLYTILFSLIALSTTFAAPVKKAQPDKLAATVQWYEDKLSAINDLVGQLKVSVDSADSKAAQAQADLAVSQADLEKAGADLKTLQEKFDHLRDQLSEQKAKTAKFKLEAHRNAVERDICLYALAIAVTALVMACAGKIIAWISTIYPPAAPFGALIEIGLAVGTFFVTYGAGRGILAVIYSHL